MACAPVAITAMRVMVVVGLLVSLSEAAAAERQVHVRVIAQQAPVHSGPATSYRLLYTAARGQVFRVLERATTGYWLRIELDDGTTGWIFGDHVFPFEDPPAAPSGFFAGMWQAVRNTLFAPSPVTDSAVQLSFSAGALDTEGFFLLRPSWIIEAHWALEAFGGLSPRATTDVFVSGLGWTLRLIPGAAVGPYVNAGAGAAFVRPKADNFIDEPQTLLAINAGGGIEMTFKKQITVRLDFRNWTLMDPEDASSAQELSGGLAIFF